MTSAPTPEQLLNHLALHPRYHDKLMSYPSVLDHLAARFYEPPRTIHTWLTQAMPAFDRLLVLLCTEGNRVTGLATIHGELTENLADYTTVTALDDSALAIHGARFLEVLGEADIDPTGTLTGLGPQLREAGTHLWLATWWTVGQMVGHILERAASEQRVAHTAIPEDLSALDNRLSYPLQLVTYTTDQPGPYGIELVLRLDTHLGHLVSAEPDRETRRAHLLADPTAAALRHGLATIARALLLRSPGSPARIVRMALGCAPGLDLAEDFAHGLRDQLNRQDILVDLLPWTP